MRPTSKSKSDTLGRQEQNDRRYGGQRHLEVQIHDGQDVGRIRRPRSRSEDHTIVSFGIRQIIRNSSPDQYRFLDTKLAGIQLESHESSISPYDPLIRQQVTKWICDQYHEV